MKEHSKLIKVSNTFRASMEKRIFKKNLTDITYVTQLKLFFQNKILKLLESSKWPVAVDVVFTYLVNPFERNAMR